MLGAQPGRGQVHPGRAGLCLRGTGLHDFKDIQKFAAQLDHTIYGIEPGNDGNRLILGMISGNTFGLGDFKLLESSEQGMLAQVERAMHAHRRHRVPRLGPHPMNMRFDMRYLAAATRFSGPNFGGATIYTNIRAGYAQQCPNVAHLLRNLSFTVELESELMSAILDQHRDPQDAARDWLAAHPDMRARWLDGVSSFAGAEAAGAHSESGNQSAWSRAERNHGSQDSGR